MSTALVLRKQHYVMPPYAFGIQCDKCDGFELDWSEYESRVWCKNCKVDTEGTKGIFGGPIPIELSKLLGWNFDKWDIEKKEYLKFVEGEWIPQVSKDGTMQREKVKTLEAKKSIFDGLNVEGFVVPKHPKILKSFEMANKAHGNQEYGDGVPYLVHLMQVYAVLLRFGFDENNIEHFDILVAIPLHDSMEDTALSYTDISKEQGEDVADIVFCMTDNKEGKNRKEKKNLTYPKLQTNPDSIVCKLADRIANMENSLKKEKAEDKDYAKMYVKEYKKFRWMLHRSGHSDEMWGFLDRLVNSMKAKVTV